ncbi:glycoside hydrolase family 2 TIM barrel-domain containing protein [Pelagicoccus sp. SDUM812002]|uniref:glycoside hydrolase family 2 TIM barrel-domain containing protein n=1 Tax=Pelagicoccus sp. SDUM812002 TaxID=3041266 RepID=UPI0028101AF6|nr:glycoside hydrolase family 2 TIM barrel-domain containing protein [Pelagicoccus sp. SDUM812002]MDQ8187290.1 glycoside hydrolase family 2 TIM barrel-domain containing protein [Pelagicoccus sp. SDUM812002]
MSLIDSNRIARVEVRKTEDGYSLYRDGEPFFVKGAAGFEHVEKLAAAGGNSLRTWGIDQTEKALPDIRRLGLSLCAGLWMVPPRQGFDYSDVVLRESQFETLKGQVHSLSREPSLLVWGVGNELELGVSELNPDVWNAVEQLAAYIKNVDPLRPVMTVLASVNQEALQCIDAFCPSIDFVSFNSYGDLERVQSKLDVIGWERPYLITEWGANGHWEVRQTAWGAEIEPSSTEKAAQIRRRYQRLNGSHGQCLGSYVFLWGNKQERTPTWYGLFDEKGRATESVAAISSLWTVKGEDETCPQISSLKLASKGALENVTLVPGDWVEAVCELSRGVFLEGSAKWSVACESDDKKVGGDRETASELLDTRFEQLGEGRVCFAAPSVEGPYRLFVELQGPGTWVATANLPFQVRE